MIYQHFVAFVLFDRTGIKAEIPQKVVFFVSLIRSDEKTRYL